MSPEESVYRKGVDVIVHERDALRAEVDRLEAALRESQRERGRLGAALEKLCDVCDAHTDNMHPSCLHVRFNVARAALKASYQAALDGSCGIGGHPVGCSCLPPVELASTAGRER